MSISEIARLPLAPAGREGPALIAHRGGNTAQRADDAVAALADYIEVDLWVHNGQFEARHERRFPWQLPFLFEKWYLQIAPRHPFGLAELLARTDGGTGVFLDLKGGGVKAAELVQKSIERAPRQHRVVASSQQWPVLRALRERCPEVDVFYSIDVQAKLDLFRSVSRHDLRPRGISCRHTLLTPAIIHEVHSRGMLVVAWTVDDPDRASTLASWGVDGITTHRVMELRARLGYT